jgi:hypothetical protein
MFRRKTFCLRSVDAGMNGGGCAESLALALELALASRSVGGCGRAGMIFVFGDGAVVKAGGGRVTARDVRLRCLGHYYRWRFRLRVRY